MYSNFGENALSNYGNREIIGTTFSIQARELTAMSIAASMPRHVKWSP